MPYYRIAILSDIHGNLPAFEAVLADLEPYRPLDAVLVAGDMIAGPGQQEVLRRLVALNAVMIQGNNEQAIARMAAGSAPDYYYTSQQFAILRWTYEHLDADQVRLVCSLPEQRVFSLPGAAPIRVSHGSPRNINELVIPPQCETNREKYIGFDPAFGVMQPEIIFQMASEPVIVFGHTHMPWCVRQNGRLALNPGAVCFPENGYVGAQYVLLDWDGARWIPDLHAIPYDTQAFVRSNDTSGFLDTSFLARIFLAELLDGKDRTPDFFKLASRLAEEAGCGDLPYIRDDIWEQAGKLFVL